MKGLCDSWQALADYFIKHPIHVHAGQLRHHEAPAPLRSSSAAPRRRWRRRRGSWLGAEAGDGRDESNRSMAQRLADAKREQTAAAADSRAAGVREKGAAAQLAKLLKATASKDKESAQLERVRLPPDWMLGGSGMLHCVQGMLWKAMASTAASANPLPAVITAAPAASDGRAAAHTWGRFENHMTGACDRISRRVTAFERRYVSGYSRAPAIGSSSGQPRKGMDGDSVVRRHPRQCPPSTRGAGERRRTSRSSRRRWTRPGQRCRRSTSTAPPWPPPKQRQRRRRQLPLRHRAWWTAWGSSWGVSSAHLSVSCPPGRALTAHSAHFLEADGVWAAVEVSVTFASKRCGEPSFGWAVLAPP